MNENFDLGEFKGTVLTLLQEISSEIKTLHERIDKRDTENQDLIRRVTKLESDVDQLKDFAQEVATIRGENTEIRTTLATLRWVIGIGIAGAGAIGAILAAIIPTFLK